MEPGGGSGSVGPPRGDGSSGGGGGTGGGGDRGRERERERDRISGLPDEACHRIMSFLKAWDALRTSELSRRWRNLWSTAPRLDIRHPCSCAESNADEGRHRRFVHNLLLRRRTARAPLDTLRMCWSHGGEANTWLAYAVRHDARVIELSGKYHRQKPEPEYTSFISDGFDRLKILKLARVKLDRRIIRQLCSSFQELELKNCHVLGVAVQSTSLKGFTMINCFTHKVLSVDAPNLVSLRCIRPYGDVPEIKNAESLVRATIMLDDSRLRSDPGDMPPPDDKEDDESDSEAENSDGINYDESDPSYDDTEEYYDPDFQGYGDLKRVEPVEYYDRTMAYGEIAYESSGRDGDYGGKYDFRKEHPIYTGHGTLDMLSNVRTMDLLAHSGEIVLRRELLKCPMFINLKTLFLGEWCIAPEFVAFSIILEHSPNLESLYLHLDMDYDRRVIAKPGARSFACNNLKMVMIICSKDDTLVHKLVKFLQIKGVPLEKFWVRRIATNNGKILRPKRKPHGKAAESSEKQRKV